MRLALICCDEYIGCKIELWVMMRIKHWMIILFSGSIWFVIGAGLMFKGLRLIVYGNGTFAGSGDFFSHQMRAVLLISIGLLIGFIKGRFILIKTIKRLVTRILSLSSPIKLRKVYSPAYFILIGGMMALGMLMNVLPISLEIRGLIDVAIGSALINGAMIFLRFSIAARAIA